MVTEDQSKVGDSLALEGRGFEGSETWGGRSDGFGPRQRMIP